jgi:hypothetical protein
MPSPKVLCEFCEHETRRDVLAEHVKNKHVKEVALMLLKEYQSNVRITPILQYASGKSLKNIPVNSEKHEGTYWFGIKPRFFDDDESYKSYIEDERNIAAHEDFLLKCFDTLTLKDYFIIGRELSIQSPEITSIKAQSHRDRNEKDQAQMELSEAKHRIAFLEGKLADIREEIDENGASNLLKQEVIRYKRLYEETLKELKNTSSMGSRYEALYSAKIQEVYDENLANRREMEQQMMTLLEQNRALRARNEKEKDREVKKDSDKEKKKKEKLKAEIKAAKAKAKALKKKLSDSDSDSGSESD